MVHSSNMACQRSYSVLLCQTSVTPLYTPSPGSHWSYKRYPSVTSLTLPSDNRQRIDSAKSTSRLWSLLYLFSDQMAIARIWPKSFKSNFKVIRKVHICRKK